MVNNKIVAFNVVKTKKYVSTKYVYTRRVCMYLFYGSV